MKQFIKNILMIAFLVIILINIPFYSHAQDDIGIPCDYQDPDIPCPIDGGLIVLLAVGVGYGIKKVLDVRKPEA